MSVHPAESFRTIPQPVTDFGPRAEPVDVVLRVEQPAMPLLPSVETQVRRARHGLDLVVRLAAENGLNVIGRDLQCPDVRDQVIHLTAHNAALAQLGLHDSQVTITFGLNSRSEDRARVHSFWSTRAALERVIRSAIDVLGLSVVTAALTEQVRAGVR